MKIKTIIFILILNVSLFGGNYVNQLINNKEFIENITLSNFKNLDLPPESKLQIIDSLIPNYETQNNYDKAIKFTEYAIELSDNKHKYYFTLISLFKRTNQDDKIDAIITNLIRLNRTNFNFYRTFSEFFISIGETQRAVDILLEARKTFNNQHLFFWELVNLYESLGNYVSVINEYTNYLNRHHNNHIKNNFVSLIKNYNLEKETLEIINSLSKRNNTLNDILIELNLITNNFEKAVEVIMNIYTSEKELNKLINRLISEKYFDAVEKINNNLLINNIITSENFFLNILELRLKTDKLNEAEIILYHLNSYDTLTVSVKDRLYTLNSEFYYINNNFNLSLEYLEKVINISSENKFKLIELYIITENYSKAHDYIFNDTGLNENYEAEIIFYKMITSLLNNNFTDYNLFLSELKKYNNFDIEKNTLCSKLLYLTSLDNSAYDFFQNYIKSYYNFIKSDYDAINKTITEYTDYDNNELYYFLLTEILNYSIIFSDEFDKSKLISKIYEKNEFYQMTSKALYFLIKINKTEDENFIERFINDDNLKNTIYYNKIIELLKQI